MTIDKKLIGRLLAEAAARNKEVYKELAYFE